MCLCVSEEQETDWSTGQCVCGVVTVTGVGPVWLKLCGAANHFKVKRRPVFPVYTFSFNESMHIKIE